MRLALRARGRAVMPRRPLIVRVVVAVVTLALAASVAVATQAVTSPAVAQPPVPAIDASANGIVLGSVKSELLLDANRRLLRQRIAQRKAARVAQLQALRARVVQVARRQLGDRYSAGSTGPDRFDCSGLTRYVYRVAIGKDLPHQSRAQYGRVKRVSRANALPGDLVFFFRSGAHHVGIYIGRGHMIDAAGYGKGVRVSPISGSWWSRTYSGIGRILPTT